LKKLITVKDIENCALAGERQLYIDSNTIITPAAKDAAREKNIQFTDCPKCTPAAQVDENKAQCSLEDKVVEKLSGGNSSIDMDLIYKVVKEVLAQSLGGLVQKSFLEERDVSGLKLVRGNTVECDKFETGNPTAKVGLKDIVNTKESPNMGAGFMTIEKSSFDWELCYEEFDYIVEGELDITINGKRYKGKAGDVFFIPKNSKITWSTESFARFFYVTYPANWAELAANK
jgi:ethanolamine utilization protein EutQ